MLRQVSRAALRTKVGIPQKLASSAILATRFNLSTPVTENKVVSETVNDVVTKLEVNGKEANKKGTNNGDLKKKKKQPWVNRKVFDISRQVQSKIQEDSIENLSESIQILEEGVGYLREIQQAEGISEQDIVRLFANAVADLFDKAATPGANLGEGRTLNDLLNTLVELKLATGFHFSKLMAQKLKLAEESESSDIELYEEVLNLWVSYLAYSKDSPYALRWFPRKQTGIFWKNDVLFLAYYGYLRSIFKIDHAFDGKTALKIFQIKDFPSVFFLGQTVVRYGIKDSIAGYNADFGDRAREINSKSLDPNGEIAYNKIDFALERKSLPSLVRVHEDIVKASKANGKPINEATLIRFMKGYRILEAYDSVFVVFQEMISNGITKPSNEAWEVVLAAYTNPSNLESRTEAEKSRMATNVHSFIETIIANENTITPRLLSFFVESFANLGKIDDVDAVLKQFEDLDVLDRTKDSIIIGLLSNHDIKLAEEKFNEFSTGNKDKEYIPSIKTVNSFLQEYVKVGRLDDVDLILKYAEDKKIPYDWATINILLNMYLNSCTDKGLLPDHKTILQYFIDAEKRGIDVFNAYSINSLMSSIITGGADIKMIRSIYQFATKQNIKSDSLQTTMINSELKYGSIKEGLALFFEFLNSYSNSPREWNMVLKNLIERGDDEQVLRLFKKMKFQKAVKPNFYTYYFMLQHFSGKDNREATQSLLDSLNKGGLNNYGDKLPAMFKELKSQNYEVNPELLNL